MNENDLDLSNLIENVNNMVNNGNIPDELKELINNFKNTSEESGESKAKTNTQSSNFDFSSIDINTLLKFKSVFNKINSSDDPGANLLRSLKPYLKDSRKSKIDQYIQLLNISKVIDIFNFNGGESKK